ncbi:MAG: hypothetical protein Kow0031_05910 [Anaerolineae bacterium]
MTHTQPELSAVSAARPPQTDTAPAGAAPPRSPLQLLADALRLYFGALPELVAIGAAGYLLLLLALLPAGWAYQSLPLPDSARPALTALLLVGGVALLALTQALVTAAVGLAVAQKQQAGRAAVGLALRGALARTGSLLAVLAVALVLLAVALVVTGIPVVGAMLSPGLLAATLMLAALAPALLATEPLRGVPAMARAWGLARPHLFRAFAVLAPPALLFAALLGLPAALMLAAGLSPQLTDLWLPLLPGVFAGPLLAVAAVLLAADLRCRAAAAGIEPDSPLHTAPGHGGLMTLAEAGQVVVLSLLLVGLAGLLGLAGWGVWQSGPLLSSSPPEVVAVGTIAPDFQLESLAGPTVSLESLAGKPVVINFWATWCPPCKEEMPALEAAFKQHGDHVNFLAVNVQEDRPLVNRFVQQFGLSLPVLLDFDGDTLNLYGVRGLPTTVFVDAEGRVAALHLGGLTEESLAEYLDALLAE